MVGNELVITRLLNAPAALVFDAFTDLKHLPHWWGPHGFTTTTSEIEVRPGGEWRYVMHGPDGRDYRNHIVFLTVDRPKRLVFRHVPEPGTEDVTHETTVTLETRGAGTFVTLRMVFPTAENRDYVVRTYGADEGGRQTLERLALYLEQRPNSA